MQPRGTQAPVQVGDVAGTTSVPLVVTPRGRARPASGSIDVDAHVGQAVSRAELDGREVLQVSEVGQARVDAGLLGEVLDHLLGVAVALTPPATTLVLAAVPTQRSIVLSVEDDAPPRLDPTLDWLFDESPRRGFLDRPAAGACAQLARLSRVVSAVGGLAWIEEGFDGGSCLVVELPTAGVDLVHSAPAAGRG